MADEGHATITVVNEDNGKSITIEGSKGARIQSLVDEMYQILNSKFGVSRRPDDRLRCESTGADVFQFGNEHLKDYIASGKCAGLVWLFASGTGGAGC